MKYEVAIHWHGRRLVQNGPAEGLLNWPEHKWTRVTRRPVGLRKAQALADSLPVRAVVCLWGTAQKVYDNGKAPGVPLGWWPATANTALE